MKTKNTLRVVLFVCGLFIFTDTTHAQVMEISHRTFKVKDKLIPYRVKDKWGYADSTRKVVIPVQFDAADLFSDGRARVMEGNKMGVINEQGEYYIKPEFFYVEYDFDNGTFKAKRDSLSDWLYLNKNGTFTDSPGNSPDDSWIFFGEMIEETGVDDGGTGSKVFYAQGKAGYYKRKYVQDKVVTADSIPALEYDSLKLDFDDNVLMALKKGKWGLIGANGVVLTPFAYEGMNAPNFYEVFQAKKKGKWGLINKSNKVVLPFKYDKLHVDEHVRGYIIYQKGLCGHFNPDTKKLISPRYKYVRGFGLHRYSLVVTKENRKGYIDENGTEFFID